ncbi:ion channel [Sulfitobacter sp.]|uniref:ion channel n=1 Tax=Sulfitobacter sp. TaxID=1903071 RepID=UPI003566D6FE
MLIAVLISAIMIAVCFLIHLSVFIQTTRIIRPEKHSVHCFMLGAGLITLAHIFEAVLFAGSFWVAEHWLGIGALTAAGAQQLSLSFADYFYFSMANFTTLGRGDLVPTDHLRFITAIEAFVGFVLITTSGAFLLNILAGKSPIALGAVEVSISNRKT